MLTVLEHKQAVLFQKIDKIFESWALENKAQLMIMPFLLPVKELAKLDVYNNFPHQALLAASLNLNMLNQEQSPCEFHNDTLNPAMFSIPSAACYAVYLHFKNRVLPREGRLVTILGKCSRVEEQYEDLTRMLGFHMREVVALGTKEYTDQHLDIFSDKIFTFAEILNLNIEKKPATDPFYDTTSSRSLMQKISPVKYEFIFEGMAVASVNSHRNFFGERCDIMLESTAMPVFSSCVAFGLERWLAMLFQSYGNWDKAIIAVENADQRIRNETQAT